MREENFIKVSHEPIEVSKVMAHVSKGSFGALITFSGHVRDSNHDRHVVQMEYDGSAELAEEILRTICSEARERFGHDVRLAVQHRLGILNVGEASVVIAIASNHRRPGYEASRYVIEELKKRVPIWKREVYADGTDAWLKGCCIEPH